MYSKDSVTLVVCRRVAAGVWHLDARPLSSTQREPFSEAFGNHQFIENNYHDFGHSGGTPFSVSRGNFGFTSCSWSQILDMARRHGRSPNESAALPAALRRVEPQSTSRSDLRSETLTSGQSL